jgi:hypothetical protein
MSVETPQHAVSLLIQGIQLAQQRGAFQLEEASVLSSAVNFLTGGVETNELDTENDETTTTEEVVVEENETTDND